jgi:phosphate/sulfate permease
MNLAGAFVTTAVAKTVATGIIDTGLATEQTLLAALFGAIAWNLVTWWFGLPSSSTHALIGGLVGAAIAQSGVSGVQWDGVWDKVVVPGAISPVIGFAGAFLIVLVIYRFFFRLSPGVANRGFRYGQLASGTWVAFTHGANDAQKTMGVLALALYTNGNISTSTSDVGQDLGGLTIAAARMRAAGGSFAPSGSASTDAARARLLSAAVGGNDALCRYALRFPDLDDPRRDRLRHGGRGDAPLLGRSLGACGQHRHRLGADAAGRRPRRSGAVLPGALDLLG